MLATQPAGSASSAASCWQSTAQQLSESAESHLRNQRRGKSLPATLYDALAGCPETAWSNTARRSNIDFARLSPRSCAISALSVAAACCITTDFRHASKTLNWPLHAPPSVTLFFMHRKKTDPGTLQSWFTH